MSDTPAAAIVGQWQGWPCWIDWCDCGCGLGPFLAPTEGRNPPWVVATLEAITEWEREYPGLFAQALRREADRIDQTLARIVEANCHAPAVPV